jgi:hypothetical protein
MELMDGSIVGMMRQWGEQNRSGFGHATARAPMG